jgi:hypothetical protein
VKEEDGMEGVIESSSSVAAATAPTQNNLSELLASPSKQLMPTLAKNAEMQLTSVCGVCVVCFVCVVCRMLAAVMLATHRWYCTRVHRILHNLTVQCGYLWAGTDSD